MFIIAIFTAKEVKDQFVRCFKECGAIIPIKSGFPDTVYLLKLSVPQNVFTWMEQIATKKNEEYNPHPSHGCFQVESREQHSLECHGCFQITQKWSLSKLTFLVSLKVDADAIEKLTCTFKVANGCKDFQLMPNIMCDYAANSGIAYLDLTKLPMEVDSVDDTGKHASAPVENFFVVKWKENDSEESGEDAAFANVSSV
ncbi:unnamed protein product [Albugo candida]|uniref:Uncharacterized protein n=1 Tax=Albugo candida TaxID=65357 RepID=A0A024GQ93_9STRA|nr:unnamed protein product [Albugo candida]|eukprot:CCI48736.1 unnamed protein product [Albugo candida]